MSAIPSGCEWTKRLNSSRFFTYRQSSDLVQNTPVWLLSICTTLVFAGSSVGIIRALSPKVTPSESAVVMCVMQPQTLQR